MAHGGWVNVFPSTLVHKYSDDQPRDENGRFASVGSLGTRAIEQGGFSVSQHGGTGPTSGYMVSLSGSERTISLDALGARPKGETQTAAFEAAVAQHIGAFRQDFADRLAQDGAYLGGWVDGGQLYLDVSMNVETREEALALGKEHDQLAIYDVAKDEYVDVPGRKAASASEVAKAQAVRNKVLVKVTPDMTDEDIAQALISQLF